MRQHSQHIGRLLTAIVASVASSSSAALSHETDAAAICRSGAEAQSTVQTINSFSVRNFSQKRERQVTVENAAVVVKLLTPLNSEINREGDVVQAEVLTSELGGRAWLPRGTVLTGCIERADLANYARTNAKLYIRFYEGNAEGRTFELNSAPTTADTAVHPGPIKLTTKAKVRKVLMAATFVAVPLAVGSLGTSLAITAGAGALIGGALADDGKHLQGAVSGAWEGAGLGIFDPIVRKGKTVILPVDTKIALQLRQPAQIPAAVIKMAHRQQADDEGTSPIVVGLDTKVTVLQKKPDPQTIVRRCDVLLAQNDLASALALLDRSLESNPDDKSLVEMRQRLFQQINENIQPTETNPNL
jgi:hypothetical protein